MDKGLWTLVVTVLSEITDYTQISKCTALVYFGMVEECPGLGGDSKELRPMSTFSG